MSRQLIIVLAIVAGVLFFFGGRAVVRRVRDNRIVGNDPDETAVGLIRTPPRQLLFSANEDLAENDQPVVDLDQYSLGRSLKSEHGRQPESVRIWVAWAIRNNADRRKTTIFNKLTRSRNSNTSGKFARQRTDSRFAATNQAPRFTDIAVAADVLVAPKSTDPTRGATNFFSPRAQDALFRRAQAGDPAVKGRITRDAAAQRRKWLNDGLLSRGTPPGVSPREVEFFGRAA